MGIEPSPKKTITTILDSSVADEMLLPVAVTNR